MKSSIKIELHPLTLVLVLASLLTGYVKYVAIIFAIVLIHELGHVAIARLFARPVTRISLLPFGGLTEMDCLISADIHEDLLIAIGGILFQTLLGYALLIGHHFGLLDGPLYTFAHTYNILIIGFNLLPICPLDGYKIVKLFSELILPYKLAYVSTLVVSAAFLSLAMVVEWTTMKNNIFVLVFLIIMLVREFEMRAYATGKFYSERLTYDFYYARLDIPNMSHMYKNRTNYIAGTHEKDYLRVHFTAKRD